MKRHSRKPTAKRNLALVLLLAALLLGAALTLRFMDRTVIVLVPEWRELPEVPKDQNATILLDEANLLLPKAKPLPLMITDSKTPGRKDFYVTPDDSIARFLKIERPDNDPEFLAFLHQCEPAATKVRESLARPLLWVKARPTFRDYRSCRFDISLYAGLGGAMAVVEGRWQEGADLLIDLVRLEQRLRLAPGTSEYQEANALRELRRIALRTESTAFLSELQQRLQALRPLIPSRTILVKKRMWMLDNTQNASSPKDTPFAQRVVDAYMYVQLGRIAKFLQANKDEILDACDKPTSEFHTWCQQHPELTNWSTTGISPFREIEQTVYSAAYTEAGFYANILFIACERYRRDNGTYPAALDALVPKYLDQVENSPVSGEPYVYSVEDNRLHIKTVSFSRRKTDLMDLLPKTGP